MKKIFLSTFVVLTFLVSVLLNAKETSPLPELLKIKSFPVEWKGPNGAEVNIDVAHKGKIKNGQWTSGPDAPHVGWQVGKKGDKVVGHIILDDVLYNRL